MLLLAHVASLLVLCLTFTACSSSEDSSGGGNSKLAQELPGTKWIYRNVDYTESSSGDRAWLDYETTYLYFTSSTEGVCVYSNKSYDTDLPTSRSTDWEFFTFTTSGNNIEVTGEKHSFTATKQGNYLVESGNSSVIYEGSTMSSSDWQYVESLMPLTGSCGDNLTYSYDKRTYWLTISGTGDMYDYSKGKQPWAWSDKAIGGVTIKYGVTSIGGNAFNGLLIDFSDFDFPNSLKKIGAGAFKGAVISEVSLYGTKVVEIGDEAFADCKYLKKIYLNDEIETIGSNAFAGVTIKNSSFSLPKNLKSVGDYAFSSMTMGTLTLNDQLETIGHAVFSGVTNTTLEIPNSVKSIGSNAFGGTFSKVIIGTGLETLYSAAFIGTSSGGSMYVNLGNPIDVVNSSSVTDNDSKWTLYVPKGSKTAYAKKAPWKNFKAIYEDGSLEAGGGEGDNTGGGEEETEGSSTGAAQQDAIDAKDSRRGSVSASFSGSGTSSSPYLISSAADLRLLSDKCRLGEKFTGKYFKMTTDITINRNVLNSDGEPNNDSNFERWIPIGRSAYDYSFQGIFDGDGHTVYGIYIKRDNITGGFHGLFGSIKGATIKNLTLKDSYIEAPTGAGIVSQCISRASEVLIYNCHNYATVRNGEAGVVGYFSPGNNSSLRKSVKISRCTNHGKIISEGKTAGICYDAAVYYGTATATVTDCINYGTVKGTQVGGIMQHGANTIWNCANFGTIEGTTEAGGICARTSKTVNNCVNIGDVSSSSTAGALVGTINSGWVVKNCFYLSASCSKPIGSSAASGTKNTACSSSDMKSSTVLSSLNANKGSNSTWIAGSDGYPTLEWAK